MHLFLYGPVASSLLDPGAFVGRNAFAPHLLEMGFSLVSYFISTQPLP